MEKLAVIPEKVIDYNAYDEGDKLLGLASDIVLPSFEPMSETISGPGILGEIDSPNPGHFSSQTLELTFKNINSQNMKFLKTGTHTLTFRAAQQGLSLTNGQFVKRGLKIVVKGFSKGKELGTLSKGASTENKVTLEVLYIKIEENGQELLEFDKLNYIYRVLGEDQLKDITDLI